MKTRESHIAGIHNNATLLALGGKAEQADQSQVPKATSIDDFKYSEWAGFFRDVFEAGVLIASLGGIFGAAYFFSLHL